MKNLNKILSVGLSAFLLISVFVTGCGKNTDSKSGKGNSVITFAGWGSLAEKKIFTQMIDEFTKKNPGVKVNYQHVPGTQEDYMVKMVSNLAANKMPDVFYIHSDDFYSWAKADRLEDLSGYLAKSALYSENLVWDKALNIFHFNKETGEIGKDGALYGLPKDLGPWAMVYNKTLFKEKGVPLPDPAKPMMWDEFVATAKKLTDGQGVNKVFGCANYTLESAVWSNGADFLSADKKTVTVDTPAFAQAMQWVADLALKEGVSPTPEEDTASGWFQRWANGKVGMAWMGPWDQATFWDTAKFEWDLMPTPASPATGKGVSWLASAALCVSPSSKNKQMSYELAEFLCMDKDAQTYNYKSGQAVPNIIEMAKTDFLKMDKAPAHRQVFIDIIENDEKGQFKPTYYTENNTWYSYFYSESTKVWNGGETAEQYLKKIQPELQKRLDEKS